MSRAKWQLKKLTHVTIEDWEVMKTKFMKTKYMEKFEKVQVLRKKKKEEGESTYCEGIINANEHRKRLVWFIIIVTMLHSECILLLRCVSLFNYHF